MKVYVVITNGEVAGEVEGVYTSLAAAKAKFREIKKDWRAWAAGADDKEEIVEDEFYSIYHDDEYLEVKICRTELQGKEDKKS